MKKYVFLLLAPFMLAAGLPSAEAALADSGLTLSCASCVLMEKETGAFLLEENSHEKLEPASVTKIMTLLLVMEAVDSGQLSLEDLVTVSAYAAGMGGSQVYLKEGEQMPVSEMIKCVTVVSGNDCAVALAEHLAGSEGAFVTRMNQRAQELGMEDTTFLNCTGLPAQGLVTSAHDIAQMSRELILNHPSIREYTTIWMDTLRDGAFQLSNTNRLIFYYEGATGLKTGFTDTALYCLSATAERDGMELIAVVMHAPTSNDRFESCKALLNYGFANYAITPVYPSQAIPPVEVILGGQDTVQPVTARECSILLEKSKAGTVTTQMELAPQVEAPVEAGQKLGELRVLVDGRQVDTIDLIAPQEVPRLSVGGIFKRFLNTLFLQEG